MSMMVSSVRFKTFVPKLQVRTASGSLTAPLGTKSVRMWALAPGGKGEGNGSTSYGGGGGEMRAAHVISIEEGQTVSFNVQTTQNTTITFNGTVIVQANTPPRYYTGSSQQGGSGGFGGYGRNGGSGSSGDVSYYGYTVAQGGGAGGPDTAGGNGINNGNNSQAGARGTGRSFTDTETNITYQNGAGSQMYGGGAPGGAPGDQYINGGFVVFEWLNIELQSQVRVFTATQTIVVPDWAVRAEYFYLSNGMPPTYEYYDDGEGGGEEYFFGGQGGSMYTRSVPVIAGKNTKFTLGSGWNYAGNTAVNNTTYDRVNAGGGGGGGRNGWYSANGGGAAGTDGAGSPGSSSGPGARGPGRSFTDAISGVTIQNGAGGANYGGGGSYNNNDQKPGFGAVIFYSV